jgi:hypothetical protein
MSPLRWRKWSTRWRRSRRAGGAMEMEEGGLPRSGAVEMLAGRPKDVMKNN